MRLTWALKRRPDIEKEFPFARPDLRIGYPVEPVSVTQIYQSQYREEYAGAETHRPLNLKRRKLAGIQIGVTSIHKSVGIDLGLILGNSRVTQFKRILGIQDRKSVV